MTQKCIRCNEPRKNNEESCAQCGGKVFTGSPEVQQPFQPQSQLSSEYIPPAKIKTPLPEYHESIPPISVPSPPSSPLPPSPLAPSSIDSAEIISPEHEMFLDMKAFFDMKTQHENSFNFKETQIIKTDTSGDVEEFFSKIKTIMKQKGVIIHTEEEFIKFFAKNPEVLQSMKIQEPTPLPPSPTSPTQPTPLPGPQSFESSNNPPSESQKPEILLKHPSLMTRNSPPDEVPFFVKKAIGTCNELLKKSTNKLKTLSTPTNIPPEIPPEIPSEISPQNLPLNPSEPKEFKNIEQIEITGNALREIQDNIKINQLLSGLIALLLVMLLIVTALQY